MSNPLKKLAGQTAIYGLSSIVARFLNYLLVPLHTSEKVFTPDQYGIITEMYSYVAFLIILLTYGMETTFFRFSSQEKTDKPSVYKTILVSLFTTSVIFIAVSTLFSQSIADILRYPNNNEFVIWFAIIVGLDAISSIPLARLRAKNKPFRFVLVNIVNVAINIGLNLFFLAYCMPLYKSGQTNFIIETFYNPEFGVSYVFISNLIASTVKFLLLTPEMFTKEGKFNKVLLRQMFSFGLPLLVAGLAGMINEAIDKIMLKRMLFDDLGEKKTMTLIGIYGACYKISIIITLFIQAFRYAADPFFFSQQKEKNAGKIYAIVMDYFVIICVFIFLSVMFFLGIIKNFIPNQAFWVGLKVVPILLAANVCLGIYYNLSFWYKLAGKTMYGLYIAIFGALITLILNYLLIPEFTYVGSAWATLICYASMLVVSYYLGQKHYPIPYHVKRIFVYILAAVALYFVSVKSPTYELLTLIQYIINIALLGLFLILVYFMERKEFKALQNT